MRISEIILALQNGLRLCGDCNVFVTDGEQDDVAYTSDVAIFSHNGDLSIKIFKSEIV